jgi:hypothetical protein
MTKTEPKSQKPVKTLRDGRIAAAIWENETDGHSFYSVTPSRTYTDGDGKVQSTNSYSGTDLLKLSRLAAMAYDETRQLQTDNPHEAQDEPAPSI